MVSASLSRNGGGISTVVEALSRYVGAHGFDVRVIGLDEQTWFDSDRASWRGAPASTYPICGPQALGYSPKIKHALLSWGPDLVHSHGLWMLPSRSVFQWHRHTGRPYVVSPHGMLDPWAVRNSGWKKRIAGILYEQAHLHRAAMLHALCERERDDFLNFGLRNQIEVIPNGVDLPLERLKCEAPWNGTVPCGSRVMLFLGRIHPKKNLSALLGAWAAAKGRRRDAWRLVIAGSDQDDYERELRALHLSLGLEDSVVFQGPLYGDAKDAALRNATAFVLPSLSEGLPMAVLEALSYGLPVLMTEACNLSHVFKKGAAIRFSSNERDMVDQLNVFFDMTSDARRVCGEKAIEIVRDQYLWPRVAARMSTLYSSLIDQTNNGSLAC